MGSARRRGPERSDLGPGRWSARYSRGGCVRLVVAAAAMR